MHRDSDDGYLSDKGSPEKYLVRAWSLPNLKLLDTDHSSRAPSLALDAPALQQAAAGSGAPKAATPASSRRRLDIGTGSTPRGSQHRLQTDAGPGQAAAATAAATAAVAVAGAGVGVIASGPGAAAAAAAAGAASVAVAGAGLVAPQSPASGVSPHCGVKLAQQIICELAVFGLRKAACLCEGLAASGMQASASHAAGIQHSRP